MLGKLIRHGIFIGLYRFASAVTGVKPHYKVEYGVEMQRPYWIVLRWLVMRRDKGKCQCSHQDCPHSHGRRGLTCTHPIGKGNRLQMHHVKGTKRLQGWNHILTERDGCVMLCDRCHHN